MLRRAPSFSRQRRAPKLPPAPNAKQVPPHIPDVAPTYTPTSGDEVKLCKALRGWLKKRHASDKKVGPKWGKRYVWVDDVEGTLCYSKSHAQGAPAKQCVRLSEVMSVHGSEGRADLPANCIVVRRKEDEFVFGAEDREEATMWITQLGARASKALAPSCVIPVSYTHLTLPTICSV